VAGRKVVKDLNYKESSRHEGGLFSSLNEAEAKKKKKAGLRRA
jgi:hypothetical protein